MKKKLDKMTQKELREVDNGHWITPSRDDEGNGSGVIFTTAEKLPVIPSISVEEFNYEK